MLIPENMVAQHHKFSALLSIIGGTIDRFDVLEKRIYNLGARHAEYKSRDEHFGAVGEALLITLKKLFWQGLHTRAEIRLDRTLLAHCLDHAGCRRGGGSIPPSPDLSKRSDRCDLAAPIRSMRICCYLKFLATRQHRARVAVGSFVLATICVFPALGVDRSSTGKTFTILV